MKYLFFFILFTFSLKPCFTSEYDKSKIIWNGSTESIADHFYNDKVQFDPKNIKSKDIICLDPNFATQFVQKILPQIKVPYILITADSDLPPELYGEPILNDPKLIAWFAINIEKWNHPKLHLLPLGAKTLANNLKSVIQILENSKKTVRKHLLYVNFLIRNFPKERQYVYDLFCNKSYCYVSEMKKYPAYCEDLVSSKFVLSPRGNGLDCWRTWEALYFGTIPIVKSSRLNPLYKDLPILVVDSWTEITEDFLNQKYLEMSVKNYDWNKLKPEYWTRIIQSYR